MIQRQYNQSYTKPYLWNYVYTFIKGVTFTGIITNHAWQKIYYQMTGRKCNFEFKKRILTNPNSAGHIFTKPNNHQLSNFFSIKNRLFMKCKNIIFNVKLILIYA